MGHRRSAVWHARVWHAPRPPHAQAPFTNLRRHGLTAAAALRSDKSAPFVSVGCGPCSRPSPPRASRASGTGCCTWSSGRSPATAPSACRTTCCSAPAGAPEIAARVDILAGLACDADRRHPRPPRRADRRGRRLHPRRRSPSLGFGLGIEAAQAAFAPAPAARGHRLFQAPPRPRRPPPRIAGTELVLALARRRVWHQFIAILAMFAAVALAIAAHAPRLAAALIRPPATIETSPPHGAARA